MWRPKAEARAGSAAVASTSLLLPPAAQWPAWCGTHPGTRPWLWAPAAQLHLVAINPVLPLTPPELAPHARGVFAHYLGEPAAQAPLAIWRAGVHRGACLLAGTALADWLAAASQHGVRPRGLWPLWAGLLAQAWASSAALRQARSARLLVVEGHHVTTIALRAARVQAVQLHRLDAPDALALADWLRAEPDQGPVWAIGHGLAGSLATPPWQALSPLQGVLPPLPQAAPSGPMAQWPDFLSPLHDARLRRWGWALAATAAAVLAVAGQGAWQSWQHAQELQDAHAMQGEGLVPPNAARGSGLAQGPDAVARQRLQHAWPELLVDVEQLGARHRVDWLALEHQPARSQLRLQGQAGSAADATALVVALSARPAWREVLLDGLRPLPQGAVAFELSARWGTADAGVGP